MRFRADRVYGIRSLKGPKYLRVMECQLENAMDDVMDAGFI